MSKLRYFLATLIAPLAAPLILILFGFGIHDRYMVSLGVPFGYAGLFLLGLPLVYILHRINRLQLGFLVLGGAIEGIGLVVWLTRSLSVGYLEVLLGWACGGSVALLFGLLAGVPRHSTFHTNPTINS